MPKDLHKLSWYMILVRYNFLYFFALETGKQRITVFINFDFLRKRHLILTQKKTRHLIIKCLQ